MRILQLSTHSTLIPRHGGKVRSHHVARVLEQEGFDVRRVAFCFRSPDDLEDEREPIIDIRRMLFWGTQKFKAYGPCRFRLAEYIATVAALEARYILAEFDERVRAAAPDAVLLEHPWTWPLLARLEEVRSGAVRVVYNSQNVEIALKRRILQEEGISAPPGVLDGVEALERDLVARAAGVSACTRMDADVYVNWGARRVVVAANGGVQRQRRHLLDILPRPLAVEHSYALAVGSNHPPNISGFMNLIVPSLPLLRPHQRVVLAGSVGPAIIEALEAQGLGRIAKARLIVLGIVDDFCLDCAIANANVLLLPIQYGGGSNVKTAEALLSRRPVIAAAAAMRGFDAFREVPNLTIADRSVDFGAAMLAALDRPYRTEGGDHPTLSSLLWESTVAPLVRMMREIEKEIRVDRCRTPSSPATAEHARHEA
jgi:Glycosyl transferase 4-like domain/Glycosyl transferases group 1